MAEDEEKEAVEEKELEAEAPPKPSTSSSAVAVEMGDIKIYPGKPMPQYDAGPAKAYAATGIKNKETEKYIAIICDPELTPRRTFAPFYRNIGGPALLPLIKTDVCFWPATRQQHFVIVYKDINAKPLVTLDAKNYYFDCPHSKIIEKVIRPIATALHDFNEREFYHGAIRPTNMFSEGGNKDKPVVLGDCLATPAAFAQPTVFETVARATASPYARGHGHAREDYYALGVSLALMMCQDEDVLSLDDEQILMRKIEVGSYVALTGSTRFTGALLELLRGLLQDDPDERWGTEDIMGWLEGRRLSPQQQVKKKQALRTLKFADEKYLSALPLALDVHKNKEEAVKLLDSGDLNEWLNRSLEDKDAAERLEHVTGTSTMQEKTGLQKKEYVVSMIRMALAPPLPIYYKDMHMTYEGIGQALARAYVRNDDLRAFHEFFTDKVGISWLYVQEEYMAQGSRINSLLDQCRQSVRQSKMGEGLERCLYLLNPDVPCLTPKLAGYYIRNSKDFMRAFEKVCEQGDAPQNFIDRHSAAFLSIRDNKVIENVMFDLNAPDRHRQVSASLKVFASIQRAYQIPASPNLAQAILNKLAPVYERFHDRYYRDKVEKKVINAAKSGDLVKMEAILNNPQEKEMDGRGFRFALHEYRALIAEQMQLTRGLAHKSSYGHLSGHNVSVIVSGVLATILTVVVVLSHLSGNSFL